MKALLDKIENYGFEYEGGPLKNCVDWQELRRLTAKVEKEIQQLREGLNIAINLASCAHRGELEWNQIDSLREKLASSIHIIDCADRLKVYDKKYVPMAWMGELDNGSGEILDYDKQDVIDQGCSFARPVYASPPSGVVVPKSVIDWARDLLVYLNVDVESLPENEYNIYEEGYDKTVAGLEATIAAAESVPGQENSPLEASTPTTGTERVCHSYDGADDPRVGNSASGNPGTGDATNIATPAQATDPIQ